MRRFIGGSAAFVVLTGTFLVLPVYAAPAPSAEPIAPSISQVDLGSVERPADEAVVATDDEVVATGEDSPVEVGTIVVAPGTEPGTVVPPAGAPAAPATNDPGPTAPTSEAPGTASADPGVPGGAAAEGAGDEAQVTATDQQVAVTGTEIDGVPALTVSQPETAPFSAVGVTWARDPGVGEVLVQLRVTTDGSTWGEWTLLEQDDIEQPLEETPDQASLRDGTAPYYTGPASGVQVVVQTVDGASPTDVQTQLVDPGTSPADTSLDAPVVQDQANAASAMPAIYSRAQWGADESIRTWDPSYSPTIKAATVHHTADSNNYTAAAVPAILRSIYAFHTISRGWGDIGYNVIVDKYGRAWEGRYSGARGIASPVVGAHSGGFNTSTFGISMLGNYETAPTTPAMVDMVAAVIAWKLSLYGVDPSGWTTLTSSGGGTSRYAAGVSVNLPTVFGHRDVGATSCPGVYGYAQLSTIRSLASQRVAVAAAHDPRGAVDSIAATASGVSVRGWALDPDSPSTALPVDVTVDGATVATVTAGGNRPDVASAFPGAGAAHGFTWAGALSNGRHDICVSARNLAGPGSNSVLGCSSITFRNDPPRYAVDLFAEQSDGSIRVSGWAFDADGTPTEVHVYDNGRGVAHRTELARPDVAALYPAAGSTAGFDIRVSPSSSPRQVCVFVVDTAASGNNTLVGCKNFSYRAPMGAVDSLAEAVDGGIRVRGWTFDPSQPTAASRVHVYVDGRGTSIAADRSRPDIAAAFPGAGAAHGFDQTISVAPGVHRVCVYSINTGAPGANATLACRSVTVAYRAPQGVVDSVTAIGGGQVRVRGWMLDQSVPTSAVVVHVYVDGRYRMATTASGSRPDIAAAFPGAGAGHGLDTTVTTGSGRHEVCVFAINVGAAGPNPLVHCARVSA